MMNSIIVQIHYHAKILNNYNVKYFLKLNFEIINIFFVILFLFSDIFIESAPRSRLTWATPESWSAPDPDIGQRI